MKYSLYALNRIVNTATKDSIWLYVVLSIVCVAGIAILYWTQRKK